MNVPVAATIIAAFLGGWEITLIVLILLILLACKLTDLADGVKRGLKEFRDATNDLSDELRAGTRNPASTDEFATWLALGFDVGRIPIAPGTFGTLVGVLWVGILLAPGSLALYIMGTLVGLALSVWACGVAERVLGKTDPGSVVLDEIAALPICFLPWIASECVRTHQMPSFELFFTSRTWLVTAGIFVLFRIFDVWKPWPVRQSQRLPGGLGVTADDVLAAIYAALASLFIIP